MRLKRGDIGGLETLVRAYQVKATRVAFLITNDTALAEDIMQTAFIRVYDHIDTFDEARPFEPWLMRIVVNTALKTLRRDRQRLDWDFNVEDVFAESDADPADVLESQELARRVQAALNRLKPEQRAVIVLRYYLGYSETEISSELQRPLGTVRWQIHAARQQLKGLLRGGSR